MRVKKVNLFADNISVLTHDVETFNGLAGDWLLKKIEEKYDLSSVWYVPSSRYKLDDTLLRELADHGEVGSHDTKHDGKLYNLKKQSLVERLALSKNILTKITQNKIIGFRSPMLQYNQIILQSLVEAGYLYDTSIPTWEPKHPYTMKPHGIGTVYPLKINGLLEIPLTLTQDHQLIHVLGLKPKEVLKTWATMTSVIRAIGGLSVFLIHPDYELAKPGTDLYEELLSDVVSDSKGIVALPSKICVGLIE